MGTGVGVGIGSGSGVGIDIGIGTTSNPPDGTRGQGDTGCGERGVETWRRGERPRDVDVDVSFALTLVSTTTLSRGACDTSERD